MIWLVLSFLEMIRLYMLKWNDGPARRFTTRLDACVVPRKMRFIFVLLRLVSSCDGFVPKYVLVEECSVPAIDADVQLNLIALYFPSRRTSIVLFRHDVGNFVVKVWLVEYGGRSFSTASMHLRASILLKGWTIAI